MRNGWTGFGLSVGAALLATVGAVADPPSAQPPPAQPAPTAAPADFQSVEGIGRIVGATLSQGSTEHFVVHVASGGAEAATALASRLERTYGAFLEAMALPAGASVLGDGQVASIVLDDKAQYDRFIDAIMADPRQRAGVEWEQVAREASGFGFGPYQISWRTNPSIEAHGHFMAHTVAHRLLRAYCAGVAGVPAEDLHLPFWIEEGLGAYLDKRLAGGAYAYCIAYGRSDGAENAWRERTDQWDSQLREALRDRRDDTFPTVRKMHEAAIQSFDHRMRAMAWSAVTFLVEEEDDARQRGKFRGLVDALARGTGVDAALDATFGFRDVEAMERKWSRWARAQGGEEAPEGR